MKSNKDAILALERGFWEKSDDSKYFRENMTDDALNVIEPMGFVEKAQAVEMSAQSKPWTKVSMKDVHVQELTDDCVSVAYHGEGYQGDAKEPYRATVSSVYVHRDGNWKLALTSHQPWKPDEK